MSVFNRTQRRKAYFTSTSLVVATQFALIAMPAAAQSENPAAGGVLDEIVITAEKQGRSLKDTATSVSAFSQDDLKERAGIVALSDLLTRLPNTNSFGKAGIAPTVRGVDGTGPAIGANAFFAGTRNRVNVQVDGRALSYNEVINGDPQMWDAKQVEVLRGPQSTLQGRNAVGGTIAITTNNPTYDFETAARAVAGNQNLYQGSLAISGPIITDQLAFRLSADHREYDAATEMFPTVNGIDDPEHYVSTTLRGKLLFEPSAFEDVRALLTISSVEFEAPQVERVGRPFSDRVSSLGTGEPVHKTGALGTTLDITWDVSDLVTFQNIMSYTDIKFERFAVSAPAHIDGTEFVWEPRVSLSLMDGRLDGLLGLYYFDAQQSEEIDFGGPAQYRDETTTSAIFAEFNYDATDRLRFTVGARGEEEQRVRRNTNVGLFVIDLDDEIRVFLPKFGAAFDLNDETTVGAIVSRGYNGGGAGFTFEAPFVNFEFDPEFVWNYELYSRSNLANNLFLTTNLFYSDYRDMQIPFDQNPDPLINSQIILNADEVVTYGAEIGLRWQANENWAIHGEIGLLESEINSPGSLIDGSELTRSAGMTGSAGVVFTGFDGFQAALDASYSGDYYSDEINDPRGYIDAYWMANAQLSYSWNRVRIYGNVINIFDSDDPVTISYGDTPDLDNGFLLPDRRFIAGVAVNF